MKVRVTILTENDKPVSALGDNPEEKAKRAWELMIALFNTAGEDRVTLEKVEIVDQPQYLFYEGGSK